MAQWATTAWQVTYPYAGTDVKSGHKTFAGTIFGGTSWDGSSDEGSSGGEHSYVF